MTSITAPTAAAPSPTGIASLVAPLIAGASGLVGEDAAVAGGFPALLAALPPGQGETPDRQPAAAAGKTVPVAGAAGGDTALAWLAATMPVGRGGTAQAAPAPAPAPAAVSPSQPVADPTALPVAEATTSIVPPVSAPAPVAAPATLLRPTASNMPTKLTPADLLPGDPVPHATAPRPARAIAPGDVSVLPAARHGVGRPEAAKPRVAPGDALAIPVARYGDGGAEAASPPVAPLDTPAIPVAGFVIDQPKAAARPAVREGISVLPVARNDVARPEAAVSPVAPGDAPTIPIVGQDVGRGEAAPLPVAPSDVSAIPVGKYGVGRPEAAVPPVGPGDTPAMPVVTSGVGGAEAAEAPVKVDERASRRALLRQAMQTSALPATPSIAMTSAAKDGDSAPASDTATTPDKPVVADLPAPPAVPVPLPAIALAGAVPVATPLVVETADAAVLASTASRPPAVTDAAPVAASQPAAAPDAPTAEAPAPSGAPAEAHAQARSGRAQPATPSPTPALNAPASPRSAGMYAQAPHLSGAPAIAPTAAAPTTPASGVSVVEATSTAPSAMQPATDARFATSRVRQPASAGIAPADRASVARVDTAARTFAEAIHRAVAADAPLNDAASQSTAAPFAPALTGTVAQPRVDAPVDLRQPHWPAKIIERIEALRDMADANDMSIRLVPDALGKIDIALRRDGDTVQVQMTAEQPQTRQLLAEAAPKLQELAEQRGVRLSQTGAEAAGGQNAGQTAGQRQHSQQQSAHPQPAAPPRARRDSDPSTTADERLA